MKKTKDTGANGLLPCPFCGGTNLDHAEGSGNDGSSGPGCGDCGALADTAELWNRRAVIALKSQDAEKAVHGFSCLDKCARLLEIPDDQPIPSGVVAAVERLVRATKPMLDAIDLKPTVSGGSDLPAFDHATVDKHLDAVLRASGSGLRHYSIQKTLDGMRTAMRTAMERPYANVAGGQS